MHGTERLLHSPAGKQWARIGAFPHHGINVPLFSLRTQQSSGIGEFPDLFPLIPWCKEIGLDIIQLLPLNDTGMETSPYSALSAFALNPIHLGLAQLPHVTEYSDLQAMLLDLQALNKTQRVDYAKTHAAKNCFLHKYYNHAAKAMMASSECKVFISQNPWLCEYALFKTLKIAHQWQRWEDWEPELRNPTPDEYTKLCEKFESEIAFHLFVQYLCFQQWREVKRQAEAHGVFLKGDTPILINRDSADVWRHPEFFLLQYSAGAPPDMYSEEGQNWGFPIYNWPAIEKDNYKWWEERLKIASSLYDIYRLDHIVGFFRIWAIPLGRMGHEGCFMPEDPSTWIEHGSKIMRMMVERCPMLPIGEDLGSVPPEVRQRLEELGICGTKVIRWERKWREDKSFIPYADYPDASLTTVSTHDSDLLQTWWENEPKNAREFAAFKGWNYTFELSKAHHREILYDSHHTGSLFHINLLQEYLALIPEMTWPNPEDERINVPGVISERNWTYRFRPSVEEIVASEKLRRAMQDVIEGQVKKS